MEFHLYTHIVGSNALHGHLPAQIKDAEKYAFWEAYDNVRQDRIRSTLPSLITDKTAPAQTRKTFGERKRHSILIEAHAWIDRTEGFVPSDAAPTEITEGFFAWMEDVAKAQYLLPRQTSRSKPQR